MGPRADTSFLGLTQQSGQVDDINLLAQQKLACQTRKLNLI